MKQSITFLLFATIMLVTIEVFAEKTLRDTFPENFTNAWETENFVIKYGELYKVEQDTIDKLSKALEDAWDVEIDKYGFPPPKGCNDFKLNIYFGGSYEGSPPPAPGSGKADTDSEGYPMIVYSKERLALQKMTIHSASHEFFHTIQMGIGSYGMDGPGLSREM